MKTNQPFQKLLLVLTFTTLCFMQSVIAQSWELIGNSGTNPVSNFVGTKDNNDLVFRTKDIERGRILGTDGAWKFGSASAYAQIDSLGKLTFNGNADYLVGSNKYAFRFQGNPNYGLFFNSTIKQYEFRDQNKTPIFYVNANSGKKPFWVM